MSAVLDLLKIHSYIVSLQYAELGSLMTAVSSSDWLNI